MTTTPQPSKEAVEAVIVYAKHKDLTVESLAILDANAQTPWDSTMITAARVLAAEVERLRAEVQRLEERLNEEISHSKEY